MNYWSAYIRRVNSNCCCSGDMVEDLSYWRNNVFAGAIIYLLPFCLIALLPGLYLSFITRQYILAGVDVLAMVGITIVAFMAQIPLVIRKVIFMAILYLLSVALLYYLGLYGPGLVYLLAACVFSVLIFRTTYKFWPAWLNTVICILFTIIISYDLAPWRDHTGYPVSEWIVVSSNLVFLSFLCTALIPRLFNGLQSTLEKEKELKSELCEQQGALQHALDRLQQKNIELEQFAYVASHDLKEPLRMVTNFMGLLKTKYGTVLDKKAHTYIDFAVDGGRRMQKMIADLLELSRSARDTGEKELVDVNEVLEEVTQNIYKLIDDNGARIIVEIQLPCLFVYRIDFVRLLQNLLSNAIKFRKKERDPEIGISATETDTAWLFRIEDNGIGIENGQHEKIFDVFTRLHSQAAYEGTGIGLAICKKIVERAGGEIRVSSVEDEGSIFCFTILK